MASLRAREAAAVHLRVSKKRLDKRGGHGAAPEFPLLSGVGCVSRLRDERQVGPRSMPPERGPFPRLA
jgi:hypothetical protein